MDRSLKKLLKRKWLTRGVSIGLSAVLLAVLLFGYSLRTTVSPSKGIVSISLVQNVAYAATERQSPDAIILQTNLSGAIGAIQDDPDAPDANWWTAAVNNADTVAHVSFPTPTGNPTVGAGLQQFKIWVKKWDGTGTPTVRIDLYENGSLVANILAATDVTSTTGQLLSGTWNANLLGTADGSLVEGYIYGVASGGKPAARATVLVGAVEWNVDYTATPSISVAPISYDFGVVAESTTPYTATNYFTITNTSAMQTDQTIGVTTSTWSGGVTWAHSDTATPGANTAGLKANRGGTWGTGDIIVKYNATWNYLYENCPATTNYAFGLKLWTPTSFGDGVEKSITVRITAVAG